MRTYHFQVNKTGYKVYELHRWIKGDQSTITQPVIIYKTKKAAFRNGQAWKQEKIRGML